MPFEDARQGELGGSRTLDLDTPAHFHIPLVRFWRRARLPWSTIDGIT